MFDSTNDPNAADRLQLVEPRAKAPDSETIESGNPVVRLSDEPSANAGVLHYLRALYRRRWLALTAFLIFATIGVLRAYTLVPLYEARVRLLLDGQRLNIVNFQDVLERQSGTGNSFLQTQLMILQSRSLARRTIQALDPTAFPARPATQTIEGLSGGTSAAPTNESPSPAPNQTPSYQGWTAPVLRARDYISSMFSSSAPQTPLPESTAESRRIDGFLSGLRVSPVPNSQLVDVRYQSQDPNVALRSANAVAQQYIEQTLELRFLATKQATDWLSERLAEQRQKVEATEQALLEYRRRTGLIAPASGDNVALQKLSEITRSLTEATANRIEKEALYRQLESLQKEGASLDAFPSVLDSPTVQQLKAELAGLQRQYNQLSQQLGEKHPTMLDLRAAIQTSQGRQQAEINRIGTRVRADFVAAQAAESSLLKTFESQKTEALSQNARGVELGVLQREAESNRSIYDILMRRAKETDITNELQTSNITILDAAELPRAPFWPNRSREIRMALLWSLIAALGLVVAFELFDNRINSPEQIPTYLQVPLLGLIPAVKPENASGPTPTPLVSSPVPNDFSEAFRMLRTNVLFSAFDDQTRIVMVTSASPGEGKTAIASNLAISIAQAGRRVLLIDGDMRRPRVHELFDRSLAPGLSNLIVGTTKASDVVRPSGVSGLWILTAGVVPPNAAELLGSVRFRSFIAGLQDHFDWVIIDSPPVLAVTDAAVIANAVRRCIYVVGSDMTSRNAAVTAAERLERVGARIIGGILNRAETQRHKYYYATYYRKEYGSYYTKQDRA